MLADRHLLALIASPSSSGLRLCALPPAFSHRPSQHGTTIAMNGSASTSSIPTNAAKSNSAEAMAQSNKAQSKPSNAGKPTDSSSKNNASLTDGPSRSVGIALYTMSLEIISGICSVCLITRAPSLTILVAAVKSHSPPKRGQVEPTQSPSVRHRHLCPMELSMDT